MSARLSMSSTFISTPVTRVALIVEGLRLVEIGVDELRVVLVEARFEDRR